MRIGIMESLSEINIAASRLERHNLQWGGTNLAIENFSAPQQNFCPAIVEIPPSKKLALPCQEVARSCCQPALPHPGCQRNSYAKRVVRQYSIIPTRLHPAPPSGRTSSSLLMTPDSRTKSILLVANGL
jgi:hypothetical protein